jgi:DNA-binding transcriptional MerR regulator
VARRAGGNVETLRFCERSGLLAGPGRMPGGHCRYGEETVRFLRALLEAPGAGFIPFLCGTGGQRRPPGSRPGGSA